MAQINPLVRPNLNDPRYWRDFARRALTCPMRAPGVAYTTHLAQYEGVDAQRAIAMMATYCFPETRVVH